MVNNREDKLEPISKTHKRSSLFGDHGGKLSIKLRIPKEEDLDLAREDAEQVKYKMNGSPDCEDDDSQLQFINNSNNNNISSTNIVFPRICQVCNKGFRSGKALGGHMRVHVQTKKDAIFSKKSSGQPIIKFKKQKRESTDLDKKKPENDGVGGGVTASAHKKMKKVQIHPCFLCRKSFPSIKSLFGHMRCHPERAWRGIQPPEMIKASPFSSLSNAELQNSSSHGGDDDDDQVDSAVAVVGEVDLTKSLGGWSLPKRGHKAISEEEDDGMLDAVYQLMRLARGDSHSYSTEAGNKLINNHGYDDFEGTNSNSLTCKAAEKHEEVKKEISGNIAETVRETEFFYGELENSWWGHVTNGYGETKKLWEDEELNRKNSDSSNGNSMVLKSKKRRKKMKLRDLESVHDHSSTPAAHQNPVNSPEKFRCATCDKSFPTHQALGGHRSSHNKFRMIIHNGFDEEGEDDDNENLGHFDESFKEKDEDAAGSCSKQLKQLVEGSEEGSAAGGAHLCKICNRDFPTGQVLGGHKRSHWAGPMEAALASTAANQVTSSGEVISHAGRRVMNFDLNEEPPVEDESSSYNSVEYPFF